MDQHAPFDADVQARHDLSDDFFALFLDPSRTYSCAYFERDDYTLEQAQQAKIDLALGKLDLRPGMTLLDIGCGWGSTMLRALDRYDVNVIGLTLSRSQYEYVSSRLARHPDRHRADIRLQGWEDFDTGVDRIVSIGTFEHFRRERYVDFFDFAYRALPERGRMLLHTIVLDTQGRLRANGSAFGPSDIKFLRFIADRIFPGGDFPLSTSPAFKGVKEFAEESGFTVGRIHALRAHYARTLDLWAAALREKRAAAVALAGEDSYATYLRYLTGCAHHFRAGHLDVMQFTCLK